MAPEGTDAQKEDDEEDGKTRTLKNGRLGQNDHNHPEEGSDEEDEDEEPRLKYASLTKQLRPVYRNGDATSAFLVAGDKMVGSNAQCRLYKMY